MKRLLVIGVVALLAVLSCGPPHETEMPKATVEIHKTATEIPRATAEIHDAAVSCITLYNPGITKAEAKNLWRIIRSAVERFRRDPNYCGGAVEAITPEIVLSVMLVESNAKAMARSKAGAIGLMQIVPFHHIDSLHSAGIIRKKDKDELWNAERNITAGTYILMRYAMNSGSVSEALARYNAGRRIAAGMPYARKVLGVHDRIIGQLN